MFFLFLSNLQNAGKGKKEQEKFTTLIEKLQDEKKKQEEHVEKVFAYLRYFPLSFNVKHTVDFCWEIYLII